MNKYEHKRILVLVKTYPHPSNKSIETVCTAGLTEDGKWIRIYPIPFRYLAGDKQFKTFQWIEADVVKRPKNKDYRKESIKWQTRVSDNVSPRGAGHDPNMENGVEFLPVLYGNRHQRDSETLVWKDERTEGKKRSRNTSGLD